MNSIEKIKKKKQRKLDIKEKLNKWEKENINPSLWSPILKINFKSIWTWLFISFFVIIFLLKIVSKYQT